MSEGRYAAAVREHGSQSAAARALGIPKTTFIRAYAKEVAAQAPAAPQPADDVRAEVAELRTMLSAIMSKLGGGEAIRVERPAQSVAGWARMDVRRPREDDDDDEYEGAVFGVSNVRAPAVLARPSARHTRVLVVGDSHFHPALDDKTTRCMSLIGHHAAATRPEHVVHIGDASDWASCCRHVRNDTWKARVKPTIAQDLRSFEKNWEALNRPMDDAGVTSSRHLCFGNHEAWLTEFENANPEAKGLGTERLRAILAEYGWSHSEYGEFVSVAGVDFVHVPLNVMGKPAGGVAPENNVAMNAVQDVVFGHTHRHNAATRTKVGLGRRTVALNVGSSMPEFYVGEYAQLTAGSAVSSGCCDVDIFDGRIQGYRFVSMRELESRYGHLVGVRTSRGGRA